MKAWTLHTPAALALCAVMGWPCRAGAARNDAIARVQALDSAARALEARLQDHCKEPGVRDPDGARIAERVAQIHVARIDIARIELEVKPDDLVPLAIQAVEAFRQSYRCDPRTRRALDEAFTVLRDLRMQVPPDRTEALSTLDTRVQEIEAELVEHERTVPKTETVGPKTIVGLVTYDGEVDPKGPLRNTYLGHLAFRTEIGGGTAAFYNYDLARHYTHRGWYLRLVALARFFPGGSSRVGVLFGPYFSYMSLNPVPGSQPNWPGSGSLFSFGVQAELQWVPFKRLPSLSINPFVTVGMGLVSSKDPAVSEFGGAYGGGGLHLCFLRGALCPGLRLTSTPAYYREFNPTVQGGLSVDLLRIADAVLTAVARKHGREPGATAARAATR
ncbi:hypothetical protein OV203_27570 [Nannocystis sp. ILAH1]|uniref:hypothetical protein n=1 Tax=unclassified Nannocystis TaxID=2627009 RepID=UPI00226F0396|nr:MULTISPECIES: hypothetical protein [unclassified Nannocystis]MCY0990935.1 hypothetical protein [Nannocystis sp. ILAH1]MCY1064438.1 hypothetical protein [Nannocystis sp. RBIL2]